jgi:cyclophilin family peptidyl-prolyl cis-trans isomerase
LLRTFAAFKSENTSNILRPILEIEKDALIRATVADILGDQPATKENTEALKTAFANSLQTDKIYNDAQLSILSAIVKLDKTQAVSSLNLALDATDFLVRRQALQLIKQNDLAKDFPNFENRVGTVKTYNSKNDTKLGQVLNTNADYLRAVSRKNGSVKAVLTTEKGVFKIDLTPEDAPLTVDNFIKLARSNYFNGLAVHRVVPNFVMQDGDNRGDGNGGPGWSIRCEINMLPYERGAVGMALSGKDTGGSQWFVTHSPQPHLDGGYTVFGKVNETDMKIVDSIVRGDKILSVKIVEGKQRQKPAR